MIWIKKHILSLLKIFFVLSLYAMVSLMYFMYNNIYYTNDKYLEYLPEILTFQTVEELQRKR